MILNESISARLNLFLSNLKPSLKQRPKPIRIFLSDIEDNSLIGHVQQAWSQLEIENTLSILDEKTEDLDFTEALINAFLIEIDNEIKATGTFKRPNDMVANFKGAFDDRKHYKIPISKSDNIYAYSWGERSLPSITIIMPLGMPIEIMRNWIEKLTVSNHVITWETRGVFLPSSQIENLDLSINSHLDDLERILSFFKIEKTHLFAICQGVNLALHALKRFHTIVHSATLWHGDYNWNDEAKCTFTQNNFRTMITMSKGSIDFDGLRLIMYNPRVIENLKKEYELEIMPLIMYPYITNKVFQNYVTISESVIFDDLEILSKNIQQQVLIVTSKEDTTAHPLGSEELHKRMPESTFYCREKGSHISFFDAPDELSDLFFNFYSAGTNSLIEHKPITDRKIENINSIKI